MALKRTLPITNLRGLHARASRRFAEVALTFESRIVVRREGEEADGRSLMDLMMLGAGLGSEIEVEVEGPDEDAALGALAALLAEKFHEGE
jgi:phosphocarrier protein